MTISDRLDSPDPIFTAHLFRKLERRLILLLKSLEPADWEKQTIPPKWNVKDVASHLLDTALRGLSIARDGYVIPGPKIRSAADLGSFIHRLNRQGVEIFRRLSPTVLISLMEPVSRQLCKYHESLDPFAAAPFAVSWAGEASSLNWFNTTREFTERWHHQQQIRLAVDRPGIMTRELYFPVLDCFMRALPFTYRNMVRDRGTAVEIAVSGECGGTWFLCRESQEWRLAATHRGATHSRIEIPQDIAWRIFTRGIGREAAQSQIRVEGDRRLALHLLNALAIVG